MAVAVSGGSAIRKMFEQGIELKKKYGENNVFDFSLGNPDLAPPAAVKAALLKIANDADKPFAVGYMPNAGYPATREALAALVSKEQQVQTPAANIIATVGAAGGLNVLFHAILSAGDEVVVPSPYFVEYGFYVGNHGGVLKPVPTNRRDFSLDLEAIDGAIGPKTRAVLVNTPNNPTGQIYPAEDLAALGRTLERRSAEFGRTIYLVSDEPYRQLNYTGEPIPPIFPAYAHSVVVGSFSKTLSLAGERIGYLAANPAIDGVETLMGGLILSNRTLGFVNAPAIGQKILQSAAEEGIDVEVYRRRRDALAAAFTNAGLEFFLPKGAFYFFVPSPVADETKFVEALLDERILAVGGSGFGLPGFLRFAFCVEDRVIAGATEGIARAVAAVRRTEAKA
ncbi:MAG: pyridoxal phosphate-dependent aminotransferase [Kiritimatiellae bacterium]|nr:pyridoxal phosphate-dependent aminotransferase [Kiritimatiellia bacterium]